MQKEAQRIGVFGGTFDPVHVGHLRAAKAACSALQLDRLIWVPNRLSPLRVGEDRTPANHRLAMVQAAIEEEVGFEVSDVEIRRQGPSYLIDTLRALQADAPDAEWIFLMGLDSLETFDRWVQVEEIVRLTQVWVMPRPGGEAQKGLKDLETRAPQLQGTVQLLEGPVNDVSATGIRERLSAGTSISDLVPEAVETYIREKGLYT